MKNISKPMLAMNIIAAIVFLVAAIKTENGNIRSILLLLVFGSVVFWIIRLQAKAAKNDKLKQARDNLLKLFICLFITSCIGLALAFLASNPYLQAAGAIMVFPSVFLGAAVVFGLSIFLQVYREKKN